MSIRQTVNEWDYDWKFFLYPWFWLTRHQDRVATSIDDDANLNDSLGRKHVRVVVTFNSFSLSQQPSLIGLFIANTKSVAVTIAEAG